MNLSKGKLTRLLVIYFLILIPLFLICIVSTLKITTELNESVTAQIEYRLDRFTEEFESIYNDFKMSAFLTALNYSELSEEYMLESEINAYKGLEIIRDLATYEYNASDLFTTYSNDKIYSLDGLSTNSVYFGQIYSYSSEDVERAIEFISSEDEGVIYLNSSNLNMFIFHFPIFEKIGETQSSINYCVDDTVIINLLQTLVDLTPSYVELTLQDESKFYFYNDGENDLVAVEYMLSDVTPYIMISSEIESIGMQIKVFNTESYFYQEVEEQQREYIAITLIGFLLSFILVLFIYRKSRTSIQSLTEHIENRTVTDKGFWGFLENSVREIIKENDEWKTTANKSKFYLKQQIAFQLFNGLYKDIDSVNKMLEFYSQELYEEHFCLIGIFVDDEDRFLDVLQHKNEILFCKITIHSLSAFIILHELPNYDYSHKLREQAILGYKSIIDEAGINQKGFCVSFVQNEINEINKSYLDILRCLEQLHDDYDGKIKFVQISTSKESENLKIVNDDLEKYKIILQDKNEKKIIELTKSINSFIMNNYFSRETKSYLRATMTQHLLNSLKESSHEDINTDDVIKSISKSGVEFEKQILKLVSQYCKSGKQDLNIIIKYINDNYERYDLSLEEVAAYGGFTKTYLSKLFKTKTDMGYIEYLSKLRMQKAHELLQVTNMPLKEIVSKVGYVDVSAFRRKFKSIYGYSVSDVKKDIKS